MSGREEKRSADHIRLLFLIFVSAVCVLFLIKLRWPKTKSIYDQNTFCIYCSANFIKLQNFTLHRIHFNTFFFGAGGGGGAFIRGSIHLEGASIRGLFFGSVGRRSSAGGGAKGGGRGAKKRKFYTLQSTRVNIWLRLERQLHVSSMSTSIYSKSLHLIIILFNYRNRKK